MSLNPVIARLEQDPAYLEGHWSLSPEAARFLYLLARIGNCWRMLEVGTSIGYSTLHLALAASESGGQVTSIDASSERQTQAAAHLEEAGLAGASTLLTGDALATLEKLQGEGAHFDLMFLDARKSQYLEYFRFAETLLVPGGILLADNTRSHRKQMLDFIEAVTSASGWVTSELDTPSGLILARKREQADA